MFLSLIKKELLALSRDIHGLGALFFLPVVFIIVMSMALKDVYSPEAKDVVYAIVQQDKGEAAQKLVDSWTKDHKGLVTTPDNWLEQVRAGKLKYVLKIDSGFSSSMNTQDKSSKPKVHLLTDPGLDNALFQAYRAKLTVLVGQLQMQALLSQFQNSTSASSAFSSDALVSAERSMNSVQPTSVQQNVPAWLVFGMFFVVTAIAGLFVEERGSGTLARLRSLGVSPSSMIFAKIAPYILVNGIQAALMLAVGVWFMPLIGGDALTLSGISWGALLVILISISAAAVSLALAIACLVRTHAQASSIGPILNVLMAAMGGVMVPIFVMPSLMQQIARFSPMNWGLEGLLDIVLRGGGVASVLPEAARLWAFAVLMLVIAYALFRRQF